MTVIATALKHLMAAGVTGDALIAAIAEIEAALPGAQPAEPTRSKAAIRQERYRRNKTSQSVTEGITNVTDDNASVTCDDERNAAPRPCPPNDNNSNPPTPTPENITPARERRRSTKREEPFVRPDWVPEGPWDGYVEMRVRIKKPMTDHAKRLAVDELARLAEDGHPPGPVLNQSTFKNYLGVFPLKDQGNGNGSGNRNHAPGHHGGRDNRDGIERALDRQGYGNGPAGRSGAGEGGSSGELPFASSAPL